MSTSTPTSKFCVIDTFSSRADLARRIEIKYVTPGADIGKLRCVLNGSCRSVVHKDRISTVRSVYFDDLRFSACRANLDGLGRRNKLRLRWYDRLRPGHDVFFEIKWRNNRVTGKHRLHFRSQDSVADLSYQQIAVELERSLPREYLPIFHRYFEPTVLVEYKREHFVSREGGLRFTIDYDVVFYDQSGKQQITPSFGAPLTNLVVVEGKTTVGQESRLQRLLYPIALRASRCSKYVHGCRVLGLSPHID